VKCEAYEIRHKSTCGSLVYSNDALLYIKLYQVKASERGHTLLVWHVTLYVNALQLTVYVSNLLEIYKNHILWRVSKTLGGAFPKENVLYRFGYKAFSRQQLLVINRLYVKTHRGRFKSRTADGYRGIGTKSKCFLKRVFATILVMIPFKRSFFN